MDYVKRRSALYLLGDVLVREALEQSLSEWMLAGRTRVDRLSWPAMAAELARVTQGQVDVTVVTLRSWFVADREQGLGGELP